MGTLKRRSNGAGTLIKTSTGLFIAKWEFQGKTYTRSTKLYDREQALVKLNEYVRPYMEQNEIAVLENLEAKVRTAQQLASPMERVELDKMFDKYINHLNVTKLAPRTRIGYMCSCDKFVQHIHVKYPAIRYVDQVTEMHAKSFLEDLKSNVSTLSYNNRLTVIKLVFKKLRGVDSPFKNFFVLRGIPVHEKIALTPEQLANTMKEVDRRKRHYLKLLFTLAIYTGMRESDCCKLKWNDIDMERGIIHRLPIKTKRTGVYINVPIHEELKKVLESTPKTESGYVCDELVAKYESGSIVREVLSVLKKSNVKKVLGDGIGLHIFRHTFISMCANAGVPLMVVQNIVGHRSIEMVQRYYHQDNSMALDALQKIKVG